MKLYITKIKKDCDTCLGFGEFKMVLNNWTLIPCSKCSSIHPESLGLRYEKEGDNYHFYIVRTFWQKFLVEARNVLA